MPIRLTVIVLTLNEVPNLPYCLQSIADWATDVFVLDSGSTDETVNLAEAMGATIFHRTFDNYAAQRNYAVAQLPIQTDWVLFLDADEALSEPLKVEIENTINQPTASCGYFLRLQFVFMGRWIRHGGYNECTKLVLFQKSKLVDIERDMDELVVLSGPSGTLTQPIIHYDRKPIQFWYEKHARYTQFQVVDLLKADSEKVLKWVDTSTKRDRKRWVKEQVWGRLPILLRPFLYFFYRYIVQLGFLDGKAGFIYHFSHAFLYQFMIAAVYIDEQNRRLGVAA